MDCLKSCQGSILQRCNVIFSILVSIIEMPCTGRCSWIRLSYQEISQSRIICCLIVSLGWCIIVAIELVILVIMLEVDLLSSWHIESDIGLSVAIVIVVAVA